MRPMSNRLAFTKTGATRDVWRLFLGVASCSCVLMRSESRQESGNVTNGNDPAWWEDVLSQAENRDHRTTICPPATELWANPLPTGRTQPLGYFYLPDQQNTHRADRFPSSYYTTLIPTTPLWVTHRITAWRNGLCVRSLFSPSDRNSKVSLAAWQLAVSVPRLQLHHNLTDMKHSQSDNTSFSDDEYQTVEGTFTPQYQSYVLTVYCQGSLVMSKV